MVRRLMMFSICLLSRSSASWPGVSPSPPPPERSLLQSRQTKPRRQNRRSAVKTSPVKQTCQIPVSQSRLSGPVKIKLQRSLVKLRLLHHAMEVRSSHQSGRRSLLEPISSIQTSECHRRQSQDWCQFCRNQNLNPNLEVRRLKSPVKRTLR